MKSFAVLFLPLLSTGALGAEMGTIRGLKMESVGLDLHLKYQGLLESNRCGSSREDAVSSCGQECLGGVDSECPSGQHCFSDVACEKRSTGNNGGNSSAIDNGNNEGIAPIIGCDQNGGICICGKGGDGKLITLNHFYGDDSDEKVWGCGNEFTLSGIQLEAQYDGKVPTVGGEVGFTQESWWEGWEGCCAICGSNLEWNGKISSGWSCQMDPLFSGMWLIGKNK